MEESKRKLIGSIIGLALFLVCMISLTYAYFKWRSPEKDVNLGIHDGGIKYVYSNNNVLSSDTLAPVTTYENVSNSLLYTDYNATNITSNDSYKMNAVLHINSISDSLKTNSFKWILLEGDGTNYTTVVKEGNFANATVGDNEIDLNTYITPNANKKYRFIMYIDGNVANNPSSGSIDTELELSDELVPIIPITLNNNSATSGQEGTATIYLRYGVGVYKDSGAATTKMTTTANPITIPGKDGYLFLGYYDQTQSNTNGTCSGTRLIDGEEKPTGVTDTINSGHITAAFTNTKFNTAKTLYACWKINQFNIALNGNGATTAGTASTKVNYNATTLEPSTITLPKKEYTVSYNMGETGITKPSNETISATLNGWYTAATGGSKLLSPGPNIALQPSVSNNGDAYTDANSKWIKTGNVTAYAGWTNGQVTLPELSKTGYTCKWAEGSANGTQYTAGTKRTISAATTYHAVCTAKAYTLTYD